MPEWVSNFCEIFHIFREIFCWNFEYFAILRFFANPREQIRASRALIFVLKLWIIQSIHPLRYSKSFRHHHHQLIWISNNAFWLENRRTCSFLCCPHPPWWQSTFSLAFTHTFPLPSSLLSSPFHNYDRLYIYFLYNIAWISFIFSFWLHLGFLSFLCAKYLCEILFLWNTTPPLLTSPLYSLFSPINLHLYVNLETCDCR